LGGGLGTPAYAGNISKVYFRIGSTTNATSVYNIFIRLGQNVGTTTAFPNATYTTGLTQVFASPTFTFTGVLPSQWYGIELQTPFFYDPSLSLIFEMEQTGGTGNYLHQDNTPPNIRRYGLFGSAVANGFGTGLVDFGFDLRQDTVYHCAGAPPVTLATGNTGTISWTVDSGFANLSANTGQSITALPNTIARVIASSNANNIKDTFIVIPVTATLDAGANRTVTGCAPFADTLAATLTNTLPFINFDLSWAPLPNIVSGGNTLSPAITQNVQTIYYLTATSDPGQGGCSFTDSIVVDVDDYTPVANFSYDIRLGCISDTVIFTNTSQENPNGNPSYFWSFGNGNFSSLENPTHIYGVQGNYGVQLQVTDNGCADAITINIDTRHPLDADFIITNNGVAGDDSICVGSSFIFSPVTTPLAGTGNLIFDWDFGNGVTRMNAGPLQQVYQYPLPGTYTVTFTITDTLGCQDSAKYTVFVDVPPYIQISAQPTELCVGEPVQFTDSVAETTFNVVYDFDDGTILDGLHNPRHTYQNAGVYTVNFKGEYLVCPNLDTNIIITVNDYPRIDLGEDVMLCPGLDTSVVLQDKNNPAQILQWSTGVSQPAINVGMEAAGAYWAQTTVDGCSSADTIWVKRDCYLNIPNSFTPNNDGQNDFFLPRQLLSSGVIEYDMQIFNRWGELIFSGTNLNGRGWDGRFGGKDQAAGVYVYIITARWRNGFQNQFQGNVTLLR